MCHSSGLSFEPFRLRKIRISSNDSCFSSVLIRFSPVLKQRTKLEGILGIDPTTESQDTSQNLFSIVSSLSHGHRLLDLVKTMSRIFSPLYPLVLEVTRNSPRSSRYIPTVGVSLWVMSVGSPVDSPRGGRNLHVDPSCETQVSKVSKSSVNPNVVTCVGSRTGARWIQDHYTPPLRLYVVRLFVQSHLRCSTTHIWSVP